MMASHSLLDMASIFFSSWQHMSRYFMVPYLRFRFERLLTSDSRYDKPKSTPGFSCMKSTGFGSVHKMVVGKCQNRQGSPGPGGPSGSTCGRVGIGDCPRK